MTEIKTYKHAPLRYFKLDPAVHAPAFATEGSACFDIRAFLPDTTEVKLYDPWGDFYTLEVSKQQPLILEEGHRALIPIGLIFDIQPGWSVRLHSRSGNALKRGLVLANGQGIIDNDYVEPSYIMLMNAGAINQPISDGERLCQGELVRSYSYDLEETDTAPVRTTSRDGGFGSTGTS